MNGAIAKYDAHPGQQKPIGRLLLEIAPESLPELHTALGVPPDENPRFNIASIKPEGVLVRFAEKGRFSFTLKKLRPRRDGSIAPSQRACNINARMLPRLDKALRATALTPVELDWDLEELELFFPVPTVARPPRQIRRSAWKNGEPAAPAKPKRKPKAPAAPKKKPAPTGDEVATIGLGIDLLEPLAPAARKRVLAYWQSVFG